MLDLYPGDRAALMDGRALRSEARAHMLWMDVSQAATRTTAGPPFESLCACIYADAGEYESAVDEALEQSELRRGRSIHVPPRRSTTSRFLLLMGMGRCDEAVERAAVCVLDARLRHERSSIATTSLLRWCARADEANAALQAPSSSTMSPEGRRGGTTWSVSRYERAVGKFPSAMLAATGSTARSTADPEHVAAHVRTPVRRSWSPPTPATHGRRPRRTAPVKNLLFLAAADRHEPRRLRSTRCTSRTTSPSPTTRPSRCRPTCKPPSVANALSTTCTVARPTSITPAGPAGHDLSREEKSSNVKAYSALRPVKALAIAPERRGCWHRTRPRPAKPR